MTCKPPPLSPEDLTEEFATLAPATDRVRLAGLDYARRLQTARLGATERRIALTRARRADDVAGLKLLEATLALERRLDGAYWRAVGRGEIVVPERSTDAFVLHGTVFGTDGAPAPKLTVAAIAGTGEVRRFTCTDANGYFRIDLPAGPVDGAPLAGPVFLQVSDAEKAILFRGDEAHIPAAGEVVYREIRLSGARVAPCPAPPDRVTMPNLLDLPEAEALAVLGRYGLALAQRLTQAAPQRAGLVVSQEPAAGTPVTANTKVTLVIGVTEQGDTVAVPAVVGLPLEDADARLREAGLSVGEVREQPGDPAGTVLSQDPAVGTRVPPGTAVRLVVAARQTEEALTGFRAGAIFQWEISS